MSEIKEVYCPTCHLVQRDRGQLKCNSIGCKGERGSFKPYQSVEIKRRGSRVVTKSSDGAQLRT